MATLVIEVPDGDDLAEQPDLVLDVLRYALSEYRSRRGGYEGDEGARRYVDTAYAAHPESFRARKLSRVRAALAVAQRLNQMMTVRVVCSSSDPKPGGVV